MQALAFNTDAATLSPIALFLQADIIVKIVMVGLLLASIWMSWDISCSSVHPKALETCNSTL